jgi:energy-coupling factor transporter ATP-binding protein EcfA2
LADLATNSTPLSTRRQLELMRSLQRAANERHRQEAEIAAAHRRKTDEANAELADARHAAESAYQLARQRIDGEHQREHAAATAEYERERAAAQGEYHSVRTRATSLAAKTAEQAEAERRDGAWLVLTQYDAVKGRPKARLDELGQWLQQRGAELAAIAGDTLAIARTRGVDLEPESFSRREGPTPPSATRGEAVDAAVTSAQKELQGAIDSARQAGESLYAQWLPPAAAGPAPLGVFAGLLTVAIPVAGMLLGWDQWLAYVGPLVAATGGGVATWLAMKGPARRQTEQGLDAVGAAVAAARSRLEAVYRLGVERAKRESAELRAQCDKDLADLGFRLEQLVGEAAAKTADELGEAGKLFPAMLAETRDRHERRLAQLDSAHDAVVAVETRKRDKLLADAAQRRAVRVQQIDAERDAAWQAMFERWSVAFDECRSAFRDMRTQCHRLFPDFAEADYQEWPKPTHTAEAIQFGVTRIDLGSIQHGLSDDARLIPAESSLECPALMTLAEHPTLLLTASGEGRRHGVEVLRDVMLRFLTAMRPGKVRFTILDPVGLGDNFQAFMHLADCDEQLIAGRIWSEPRDIDDQLARLTNHMETVLQKYLRSEYETIHDYNAQAGEVAEPFQVLVVAGFPTNFSETAGRRLLSLVSGGPRCGVYTLLGVDSQQRMPPGLQLDELQRNAVWLDWSADDGRFVWRYPAYERLPLELPAPLPADRVIDTIRKAGEAAKAAVRVEVPFSVVAPPPGKLWEGTCADELRVPLGRAGANRLQYVRLGKGTSQHLLVAGKTGSGKSTFLHALVTSAALSHSPDEVEFYLIDFKKGVEFKSYATHRLPHARVIAIESEREFGLSVLERLDDELKARGEKFRAAGVQNLADYRRARPRERTPRVLLIIDEFQELFVADDRLAQEASLLLDRLVRQGRAFGMHVILGTQTLSGAYSLARSTLGQIAIRVALECSEADSHLILSDERNTAARFLSRPGEAIYNAQNGLVSANEPFQVVWLPDRERSAWLDKLDDYRHERDLPRPEVVVFEGNAPADPGTNEPLVRLLAGDASGAGAPPRAWLGAAVAIKPPAHAEFHRAPGSNLLVVGAEEPPALGLLTAAVVSLVAARGEANTEGPRIVVLDGSHAGEVADGVWRRVGEALGAKAATVRDASGVTATMAELAAELAAREARLAAGTPPASPVFLVLYNAGRFRELRRREDDYSFGSFGGGDTPRSKRPDEQLADLLKNGPAVGVHVLAWCDSYNSAMRLFDRPTLREFALRVALQMSAADSSNLIDSPAASDLNQHRALFYSDETGRTEKFRPYGPPTAAWLDRVAAALG